MITEFQNTNLKFKNKEPHTYKLARPQTPYSGTRSEAISTDPSAGKIFVFVLFRFVSKLQEFECTDRSILSKEAALFQ